jgi:hypothetical protein
MRILLFFWVAGTVAKTLLKVAMSRFGKQMFFRKADAKVVYDVYGLACAFEH